VIAAWANAEVLDKLDVLPNLKALLLMPWVEEESLAGHQARHAVDTRGVHSTSVSNGLQPVV